MICEDEPLLALDLQMQVEEMGFDVLGPYASQREALRALRHVRPDAVLLDVELDDGACTRFAGALRNAGIDFIVLSGLTMRTPPPEFAGAHWLTKPAEPGALRDVLERTLRHMPRPYV
ncbi:MAG: response regulator [Hyphomicrobiales bacterium]|nr:response regulator [Hyphomicrobiales bacterium]